VDIPGQLAYVYYTYMGLRSMTKKLTITVDDEVYAGLHGVIGRRRISRFLNDLARPHVLSRDVAEGYRAMAADEEREREAAEWVEGVTGDIADDPR
jgi:predicted CopG family antitoxin